MEAYPLSADGKFHFLTLSGIVEIESEWTAGSPAPAQGLRHANLHENISRHRFLALKAES